MKIELKREVQRLLLEEIGTWLQEHFPDAPQEATNDLEKRVEHLSTTIQRFHNRIIKRIGDEVHKIYRLTGLE